MVTEIKENGLSLSQPHSKFGIDYCDATLDVNGSFCKFPYVIGEAALNSKLISLLNLYNGENGNLVLKLVYADREYVSITANGSYVLNYSVSDKSFIPPSLVLSAKGIKKKDIKIAVKKAGKGYKTLPETLRFAKGGLRVDVINNDCSERQSIKISERKKMLQKT